MKCHNTIVIRPCLHASLGGELTDESAAPVADGRWTVDGRPSTVDGAVDVQLSLATTRIMPALWRQGTQLPHETIPERHGRRVHENRRILADPRCLSRSRQPLHEAGGLEDRSDRFDRAGLFESGVKDPRKNGQEWASMGTKGTKDRVEDEIAPSISPFEMGKGVAHVKCKLHAAELQITDCGFRVMAFRRWVVSAGGRGTVGEMSSADHRLEEGSAEADSGSGSSSSRPNEASPTDAQLRCESWPSARGGVGRASRDREKGQRAKGEGMKG